MLDAVLATATLVVLCAAAGLGHAALAALPDHHRSTETLGFIQLTSSMLITFTALVLSLLISSVNADFRATDRDLRSYAVAIIRLDTELAGFGPATRPIRDDLRRYTAAVVASTWPEEAPPPGAYPVAVAHGPDIDAPNLGALLSGAEAGIRGLSPATPEQTRLQQACLTRLEALLDLRWTLVNEAHSTISPPFLAVMMLWLLIVFVSFGLSAPRNATAATFVVLVGLAVASAVFVILELDGPLDGLVKVPSEPLRHTLAQLDGLDPH